jgi:hypothetical protein
MPPDKLYRLTAACLLTHELEALLLHPQPALSRPDAFLDAHILFIHMPVVLGLLVTAELTRRASLRYGVCVFAVMHVALHWALRDHALLDPISIASWVLILLAGIFGAAYLVPQKAR